MFNNHLKVSPSARYISAADAVYKNIDAFNTEHIPLADIFAYSCKTSHCAHQRTDSLLRSE